MHAPSPVRSFALLAASLLVAFGEAATAPGAVILDRIAVIVGNHVIKTSDIDRDVRLTAFLNRAKAELSPQTRKQAAERLIDQDLIRQEIASGNYRRPAEAEAATLEAQVIHDRFGGSDTEFGRALEHSGVTRDQLSTALLWQLTVLRFIDQRFRAGAFVSDDQVRQYVEQHQAELRKQNPGAAADVLETKARELLESQQVDKNFGDWLAQARKGTRIEYKPEAFL
jgi:peptidyl-prolyl cis-trans isomerase SurA